MHAQKAAAPRDATAVTPTARRSAAPSLLPDRCMLTHILHILHSAAAQGGHRARLAAAPPPAEARRFLAPEGAVGGASLSASPAASFLALAAAEGPRVEDGFGFTCQARPVSQARHLHLVRYLAVRLGARWNMRALWIPWQGFIVAGTLNSDCEHHTSMPQKLQ